MTLSIFLSFCSLLSSVAAVPAPAAVGPLGTTFLYYVLGIGISGLPVFYDNGAAVVTDYATAQTKPNLTPVIFTFSERQQPPPGKKGLGYSFTATPDLARLTHPATLESATMFISDRSAWEAHDVGFTTSGDAAAEGKKLGGFLHAGQRFHLIEDSTQEGYMSLFCAFPSAGATGVWDLRWNVTNDVPERADGRPVILSARNFTGLVENTATWTKCRTRA